MRARNARRRKSGCGAPCGSAGRLCIKDSREGFTGRLLPMRWSQGPENTKQLRAWGTGQKAIKEAAKRCTNYGLAGGPGAKNKENRMTTTVKKIKALLGLKGTSDPVLLKQLNAAHDGVNGNPAFSAPPGDMQTFKA